MADLIGSSDIWNPGTHNNRKVTHHGVLDRHQTRSIWQRVHEPAPVRTLPRHGSRCHNSGHRITVRGDCLRKPTLSTVGQKGPNYRHRFCWSKIGARPLSSLRRQA